MVADAFRLVVAPEESYDESEVAIEKLEFASFAVGGLAAAARTPAAGEVRSSSHVEIPLADDAGGTDSAGSPSRCSAPATCAGSTPAQIVRRYPAPGTRTAEETVLAHLEFDRPEMPWAFSAAPAQGALRPWLTLVVVERAAVEWEPATGLLPVLRVPLDQLPPLFTPTCGRTPRPRRSPGRRASRSGCRPSTPRSTSPGSSRLRVLTQDTDYLAALVPTTDAGARGGLGLTGGTLDPAWTSSSDDPVRLPVYDSWEFRTGPDGDFATLALRLDGVVAPYEVGRRLSTPANPVHRSARCRPGRPAPRRCCAAPCSHPARRPPRRLQAAETATWPAAMVDDLHHELDLPAQIEGTQQRTGGIPDLPILGPRIYAALHRGSGVVSGQDWFAQLNLAPTTRVVAGLGTRVVQRDQEQLMQSAWAQLGEVQKANRAILLAQLAELLAHRMHTRLRGLHDGRLLQLAAPLAARVSLTPGHTLAADVAGSATPLAAVSGAFRRVTRPGGPLVGRANDASRLRAGNLVGVDGTRDFTRTYQNPDGVGALSPAAIAGLDTSRVARPSASRRRRSATRLRRPAPGCRRARQLPHEPQSWGARRRLRPRCEPGRAVERPAPARAVDPCPQGRPGPADRAARRGAGDRLPGRRPRVRADLESTALSLNNIVVSGLARDRRGAADPRLAGATVTDGTIRSPPRRRPRAAARATGRRAAAGRCGRPRCTVAAASRRPDAGSTRADSNGSPPHPSRGTDQALRTPRRVAAVRLTPCIDRADSCPWTPCARR